MKTQHGFTLQDISPEFAQLVAAGQRKAQEGKELKAYKRETDQLRDRLKRERKLAAQMQGDKGTRKLSRKTRTAGQRRLDRMDRNGPCIRRPDLVDLYNSKMDGSYYESE